jgi:ABC-2 type transport system permease protein
MFRAELLKLRTTRTPWTLGIVALAGMILVQALTIALPRVLAGVESLGGASVGLGASSGMTADLAPDLGGLTDLGSAAVQRAMLDLLGNGPAGSGSAGVSVICMLLLGVLAVTTDFRTGGIVPTALVVPSRLRVLAGKAGATATVALMIGAGLAVLSALGLFAAVATTPGAQLQIGAGDVLGVWGRGLLVLVLFAWLGLGIGTLIRGQVAAILVVVGLVIVEPLVQAAVLLLSGGESDATAWLPLGLGSLASTGQSATAVLGGLAPMGVGAAILGLVTWVVVVAGSGAVTFRRRDLV